MTDRFIVSTDLDGTLLDHHTYSFDAALPALELCKTNNIPVLLNTSKTASEAIALQQQLSLVAPLVVENGSALLVPKTMLENATDDELTPSSVDGFYERLFGAERTDILTFIERVRSQYGWKFVGFNDWSIKQIADNTGLSIHAAKLAADKHYSEPFIWLDDESNFDAFQAVVNESDFELLKGGRFYHLQGATNKAKPLEWLLDNPTVLFKNLSGNNRSKLICLGDNHNDVDMLNVADFPVCVRSPVAAFPPLQTDRPVYYTQQYGPAGWNEAIHNILD